MPTPNDYSRVNFSDSPREEYGQVNPSDTYPNAPSELIPNPGDPERQFSSDKASTPEAMATETDDSQNAFAELQTFLNVLHIFCTGHFRQAHEHLRG
jgi:hypothetical protein